MSQTSGLDNNYNTAIGDALKGATGGSTMDKEAFLMLLVTQFKYQDPLNPMEDKEFVAQLAQFSALEQSMTMNENLTNMLTMQQQQTTIAASNYIGREVSARGYGVALKDGKASLVQYATSEPMASGYVNILDASTSTVVRQVQLSAAGASIQDFIWDGKTNDGSQAPDGVYSVQFVAYDESGERLIVDTSVSGVVNGVSYYNGEHYLRLDDGRTVLLSEVREILETKDAEVPKDDGTETPKDDDDDKKGDDDDDDDDTTPPSAADTTRALMDEVDKMMTNAQEAQSAWTRAKEKLAALLGG